MLLSVIGQVRQIALPQIDAIVYVAMWAGRNAQTNNLKVLQSHTLFANE